MNITKTVLVPICLILGTAAAQTPADQNGDGLVSLEEFQASLARRFERLDTDGDGFLNSTEAQAGLRQGTGPRAPGRLLRQADTDGDGALSLAELQARNPSLSVDRFTNADSNGNGLLEPSELSEIRSAAFQGDRRARLADADVDGDGALSLIELQALRPGMTSEQFSRLDANGDGLLTPDERPRRGDRRF